MDSGGGSLLFPLAVIVFAIVLLEARNYLKTLGDEIDRGKDRQDELEERLANAERRLLKFEQDDSDA